MSVEVVRKQDNADLDDSTSKGIQTTMIRPQTAKPASQIGAKPVQVKQMVFFDGDQSDIHNQVA